MGPEKRIKLAICLVLFFLATGTVGYTFIDGYSPLDAFYMSVITITTVGYGEIQQLSPAGRVFTIFLILSGVGSIAFAAGAFTELVIERSANPNRWKKSMDKKIEKLKGHTIICGHGRVGAAAAEYFKKNNAQFVVIENSPENLEELQELGYHFIQGDGTREETLLKAGIKKGFFTSGSLKFRPRQPFCSTHRPGTQSGAAYNRQNRALILGVKNIAGRCRLGHIALCRGRAESC